MSPTSNNAGAPSNTPLFPLNPDQARFRAYMDQCFAHYCAHHQLDATQVDRALFDYSSRCTKEFLKQTLPAALGAELIRYSKRSGQPRLVRREGRHLGNLWGLLP